VLVNVVVQHVVALTSPENENRLGDPHHECRRFRNGPESVVVVELLEP